MLELDQEAQLHVARIADRRLLVVSDLQGHPRSIIFVSFESQYAISLVINSGSIENAWRTNVQG